jgi:signal peptidase II
LQEEYLMTLLLYFAIIVLVIFADLFTKFLVKGSELLMSGGVIELIPGVFRFRYVENPGAAMGSFSNNRWVFMIFSTVAIIGVTFYLLFLSEQNRWMRASLALIISGGVGNMFDRVGLGYVVDFIDFHAIWQYIFNIADCFVCIGAGLMVLYCILTMREELKQEKEAKEAASAQDEENNHES